MKNIYKKLLASVLIAATVMCLSPINNIKAENYSFELYNADLGGTDVEVGTIAVPIKVSLSNISSDGVTTDPYYFAGESIPASAVITRVFLNASVSLHDRTSAGISITRVGGSSDNRGLGRGQQNLEFSRFNNTNPSGIWYYRLNAKHSRTVEKGSFSISGTLTIEYVYI